MKAVRVVLALALLALTGHASVRGGDEDCYPIPVTWYSPTGIAGCTLDGPTDGIASWWGGDMAAMNACTYPWRDCGWVTVTSHRTGLTITVEIGMFGDLYTGTPNERLIDLTRGQVLALGEELSSGLMAVTVTPIAPPASAGGSSAGPALPRGTVLALPDTALGTPRWHGRK